MSGSWFGLVASETGSAGGVLDHPFGCSRQFLSRNMVASVSLRSVSSVSYFYGDLIRRGAVFHFCEHGNDLVIINFDHGVLI